MSSICTTTSRTNKTSISSWNLSTGYQYRKAEKSIRSNHETKERSPPPHNLCNDRGNLSWPGAPASSKSDPSRFETLKCDVVRWEDQNCRFGVVEPLWRGNCAQDSQGNSHLLCPRNPHPRGTRCPRGYLVPRRDQLWNHLPEVAVFGQHQNRKRLRRKY